LLVPHLLKHRCFSVRPFTITAPQGARQSTEQSLQDRRRTSVISTHGDHCIASSRGSTPITQIRHSDPPASRDSSWCLFSC
jgi:hypothetical protein